jgi:hypothetical protein
LMQAIAGEPEAARHCGTEKVMAIPGEIGNFHAQRSPARRSPGRQARRAEPASSPDPYSHAVVGLPALAVKGCAQGGVAMVTASGVSDSRSAGRGGGAGPDGTVSGPSCPSPPGQARVAVEEEEDGGSDRETGNNDHPKRHDLAEHAADHEGGEEGDRDGVGSHGRRPIGRGGLRVRRGIGRHHRSWEAMQLRRVRVAAADRVQPGYAVSRRRV